DGEIIEEVELIKRDEQVDPKIWLNSLTMGEAMNKLERLYIEKALTENGGNRTKAAEKLGISRR
ncbi:MAG: hypothetical protein GTN99_07550, partial [Candidatus Dadabacteria bacterium]|nr:hypothetical protein [Candidatus Dadabacteria bacterium]